VADREDHGRDHEPERSRNATVTELAARDAVDDDRSRAGEDEAKRCDELGGYASGKWKSQEDVVPWGVVGGGSAVAG